MTPKATPQEFASFWDGIFRHFCDFTIAYRMRNGSKLVGDLDPAATFQRLALDHLAQAETAANNAPQGWQDIGRRLHDIARDQARIVRDSSNMRPGDERAMKKLVARIFALSARGNDIWRMAQERSLAAGGPLLISPDQAAELTYNAGAAAVAAD